MASNCLNVSTHGRSISKCESDIKIIVKEYLDEIKLQLSYEEGNTKSPFTSFAENICDEARDQKWIDKNNEKFIKDTPNSVRNTSDYLTECGFICSMMYSPDGEFIIVGHSTGLIQSAPKMEAQSQIISEYANTIRTHYKSEHYPNIWYPLFSQGLNKYDNFAWIKENNKTFLKGTPNTILYNRWYFSESSAVSALEYSPDGSHIIVGHISGLIQLRHGGTGTVLSTLRNIQFPPKPIYALQYSRTEARVCYAACTDGAVYRIEIPHIDASVEDPPEYWIRADPALESLNTQFYGTPGISSSSTPFVTHRSPALSLGISDEPTKLIVGYADASIKIYDMVTQQVELIYKVHKARLQFIPRKLQRMHSGQVCALRCHDQRPHTFASGAWDNTLRIWDTRCKVGCMMTFEGVNICSDSIDLNRDHCLVGSWQPTEALTVWDLVAKKKLNTIRVQNRRPDVDGEYIYACRYWRSDQYNRKGKYGIIGGSGTNCVEVINLHNRYITASYPVPGSVLAITSHNERIAFGGTAPVFNIVSFHDPKHEKYHKESEVKIDDLVWFGDLERSSPDDGESKEIKSSTTDEHHKLEPSQELISQQEISENCEVSD